MCASISVTRSTLARNIPPAAGPDLRLRRAPAGQMRAFREGAPDVLDIADDVHPMRVASLAVSHVLHCA